MMERTIIKLHCEMSEMNPLNSMNEINKNYGVVDGDESKCKSTGCRLGMEKSSRNLNAVLVASPGMGHLNSFLGLAGRLSTVHSFKVTVIFVTIGGATHAPATADGDVSLLSIPAADTSNIIGSGAHIVAKIRVLMRETGPAVRAALSGIVGPRPAVVVLDIFGTDYLPFARELGASCFVYVANAWFLALLVHFPVHHREAGRGGYVGHFEIPGCKPVSRDDAVESMLQPDQPQYTESLRMGAQVHLFDGVLIRTWQDLEGSTLTALRKGTILRVPVYDIGPIVVEEPDKGERTASGDEMMLMEWLDGQPAESVIYISFGCGGTLSRAQMNEMALGLELSQQRFVWVVRPPKDGDSSGTYMGLKSGDIDNIDRYLPHGFRERTRDVGQLVPLWAPQSKVLSHPSVGGFLTHCGWNSVNESLKKGVPMITWPLFAEQRMNATMLVEELKVAIRTHELPTKKLVGKEEIGKLVRLLLEGDEGRRMRLRAKELLTSGAQAIAPGGSSYNRLSELVQTIKIMQSKDQVG